jgi:hypothetical protein
VFASTLPEYFEPLLIWPAVLKSPALSVHLRTGPRLAKPLHIPSTPLRLFIQFPPFNTHLFLRNPSFDMETHDLITQEITAAVRPVPWDKSFIPSPAHLSQPSQPREAEVVTSFMCERCHAFAKWHELNQYWQPSRPNMAVRLLQRLVPGGLRSWRCGTGGRSPGGILKGRGRRYPSNFTRIGTSSMSPMEKDVICATLFSTLSVGETARGL